MKKDPIPGTTDCLRYAGGDEDLRAMGALTASRVLFQTILINVFEEELLKLAAEGAVWGPVHVSVGQEAAAAAIMAATRTEDVITGSHRAHHQVLAKILNAVLPASWNPATDAFPAAGDEAVRRTLAEIMGLKTGYCGGRGGSMHLLNTAAGVMGTNAIVAGGVPVATGLAYASKFRGTDRVALTFYGDGAVNQGVLHEVMNLAGVWKLPIIYVIENNRYAVGTHARDVTAVADLCVRAGSYAMPGRQVQGDDVAGLHAATAELVAAARAGGGPALLEVVCYRHYHHKGEHPGSVYKYRSTEEEAEWKGRDAIRTLPEKLARLGMLTPAAVERMRAMAMATVQAAATACSAPDAKGARKVRPELWPTAASVTDHLRSDGSELAGVTYREPEDGGEFEEMKYSDAIAAATGQAMARNPETLIFGEDVANFGGGPYGATKDLPRRYPRQVINTPISEGGFAGLAYGTAAAGMPTVFELMYPDFCLVAADQIFNQIGKARHMFGGEVEVPVVCRTRIATGTGFGGQHSMDPAGLFAMYSGWRIVSPSNSFDAIGLLNTALRSKDPVLVLEHHSLYGQRFPVPKGDLDFCIPFGKARLAAAGSDLTVVGWGCMPSRLLRLKPQLEAEGISIEIIDLRTLDIASFDFATIATSLRKTGAIAFVEEAAAGHGLGQRYATIITERCFDDLDAPPCCLTSLDVPNPISKILEDAAMLQDATILEGLRAAARRTWK